MNVKQIPNLLSSLRIAAAPLLLALIFAGERRVFFALLILSQITDFLDGYLARRLNAQSALGAKLDILGDLANYVVGFVSVAVFFSFLFEGIGRLAALTFVAAYAARFLAARMFCGEWVHPIPLRSAKVNFYVQSLLILALACQLVEPRPFFYAAFATGLFESLDYLRHALRAARVAEAATTT